MKKVRLKISTEAPHMRSHAWFYEHATEWSALVSGEEIEVPDGVAAIFAPRLVIVDATQINPAVKASPKPAAKVKEDEQK
jgi:hypothetical protein